MHLCNLDDETSKWSLRTLRKAVAKLSRTPDEVEETNDLLKKYRTRLNRLKTRHRNDFIAHRNKEEYPDLFNLPDYRTEFQDLIQIAVTTFDNLWPDSVYFGFVLGSQELPIDLRAELGVR